MKFALPAVLSSVLLATVLSSLSASRVLADQPASVKQKLSLDKVMSHPDWIGNHPENGYFSDDGKTIYFQQKRQDSAIKDWYRLSTESGKPQRIAASELAGMDFGRARWNAERSAKVYSHQGDLYFKSLAEPQARQLTRTVQNESRATFLTNGDIAYRVDNNYFSINLTSGLVTQLTDLRRA